MVSFSLQVALGGLEPHWPAIIGAPYARAIFPGDVALSRGTRPPPRAWGDPLPALAGPIPVSWFRRHRRAAGPSRVSRGLPTGRANVNLV